MPRRPLVTIHDQVLPPSKLRELTQKVRGLGGERLRSTYQTTFWFELGGEPTNVVERVLPYLEPLVPRRRRRAVGVEWWLSRMSTHDVRVDFHRDCDERLLRRGGPAVHPLTSTVFFLNRVRGGLLAITREDPCEDNPSLAPEPARPRSRRSPPEPVRGLPRRPHPRGARREQRDPRREAARAGGAPARADRELVGPPPDRRAHVLSGTRLSIPTVSPLGARWRTAHLLRRR